MEQWFKYFLVHSNKLTQRDYKYKVTNSFREEKDCTDLCLICWFLEKREIFWIYKQMRPSEKYEGKDKI